MGVLKCIEWLLQATHTIQKCLELWVILKTSSLAFAVVLMSDRRSCSMKNKTSWPLHPTLHSDFVTDIQINNHKRNGESLIKKKKTFFFFFGMWILVKFKPVSEKLLGFHWWFTFKIISTSLTKNRYIHIYMYIYKDKCFKVLKLF